MEDLQCPRCLGTKIVKNGKTYYGVQNYKCKSCGRQFVANTSHYISEEVREYIFSTLKERSSLRAICRIFKISRTWLFAFARTLWVQTPSNLGITEQFLGRIKRLQVFGLQADEMWSFVHHKANKRWIWVIYDPQLRVVVAYYIGDRSEKSAQALFNLLPIQLRRCKFETDHWDAYKKIIPQQQHRVGKAYTYFIEGFFAGVRARVSRLVRKALSFSKDEYWHDKAIGWFFWQLNLERHPYM